MDKVLIVGVGGFIATLTVERALIDPRWRLAIGVGFIGAYTTFSTFTYEW